MNSRHPPLTQHSMSGKSFFLRVCAIFVVSSAAFLLLTSDSLDAFTPYASVKPEGLANTLVVFLALLAAGFYAVAHRTHANVRASSERISFSCCWFFVQWLIAYFIVHPSPAVHSLLMILTRAETSATGASVLAMLLYGFMLLPTIPAIFIFLPTAIIRKNGLLLGLGGILSFVFLSLDAFESIYHRFLITELLHRTEQVLLLLPKSSMANLATSELSYGGYTVTVGPACSGYKFLVLFFLLFGILWWKLRPLKLTGHVLGFFGIVMGVALSFLLNHIRLVLIMVVGSFWPSFANGLFHSAAGALLFCVAFFAYAAGMSKWMQRYGRSAAK